MLSDNGFVRARRGSRARAVGSFLPELTKKAFQKYGFSTATLLTDWGAVVGQELAACTRPERLKWQRRGDRLDEPDNAGEPQPGATLVLRVDSARALDVQYHVDQIRSRINAYFGYSAVGQIRLLQAPVGSPEGRTEREYIGGRVRSAEAVSTEGSLAAALDRLGKCVRAETQRRKAASGAAVETQPV